MAVTFLQGIETMKKYIWIICTLFWSFAAAAHLQPTSHNDTSIEEVAIKLITPSTLNKEPQRAFKSDPIRAFEPKYPGSAAIEPAASNPVYTSTVDRYGEAIAKRKQATHSTYAKSDNVFGRAVDAYNAQRYDLRAKKAHKELSDAIRDGDEAKISTAKLKYQSERRKSYEEGTPYTNKTANTFMRLLARILPVMTGVIIVGLIYWLFMGVKKVCNPELWEQSKNKVQQD